MKYKDIYMVIVTAESNWTEVFEEEEKVDVVGLSDKEGTALIMDLEDEHYVTEVEQFESVGIPERFPKVEFKNATEENKSFLIMKY